MIKTAEEIQALKNNWMKDPCWDIEDTAGFEEHAEELKAWRVEWEKTVDEEYTRQAMAALNVESIARDAKGIATDGNYVQIMQVRATLVLAQEVKRLADLLESQVSDSEEREEMIALRQLYKPS